MTLLVKGIMGFYYNNIYLFFISYFLNNMEEIILFIDGNNWYYNSKKIIKPAHIDFKKLANFICNKYNFKIKQIRYYNSIPDIRDSELNYYNHMKFLNDLEKRGIKVFTRKLQKNSTKEIVKEKKEIIDSLDLCPTCKPIVKQNCNDCIGNVKKKEKGIDIKIAVDIVRKCIIENECDKCILITGDADFIPALQVVKDSGKEVITSSVINGYSRGLRDGRFRYFILNRKDIINNCLKDYKQIKKVKYSFN